MKKLLFGLFVLIAFGTNAQVTGGKLFVSGSLGFNISGGDVESTFGGTTVNVENVSVFGFEIAPKVGYMLSENLGAGLGFGYDYTKTNTPDFFRNGPDRFAQVENDGMFHISPFARYYKSVFDKLYLYGELSFPVSFGSHDELMWNETIDGTVDSDVKNNTRGIGANLGFGANYFVTEKIALEVRFNIPGVSYYSASTTLEQDNGDKVIYENSGINLDFSSKNLIDFSSLTFGVNIFI